MPTERSRDRGGVLVAVAMVLLPALCCALPALLAAGALGAVGGWLRNPWVIAVAALVVGGGLVRALVRRSRCSRSHDERVTNRRRVLR